jgi:hypothetical protein
VAVGCGGCAGMCAHTTVSVLMVMVMSPAARFFRQRTCPDFDSVSSSNRRSSPPRLSHTAETLSSTAYPTPSGRKSGKPGTPIRSSESLPWFLHSPPFPHAPHRSLADNTFITHVNRRDSTARLDRAPLTAQLEAALLPDLRPRS